jgi:eukaryotic-like serine/threonine-protein kinase
VQHFVLRFVLWCSGMLPWRCADFLDYSVECVLLQRVGGGYIFIHRLLLEYFVALDTAKLPGDTPKPPAQRERAVGA